MPMSFDEGDQVVLHDKHSEYDGQSGTISQVIENMFGGATYTVMFDEGQEQGLAEDSLERLEDE